MKAYVDLVTQLVEKGDFVQGKEEVMIQKTFWEISRTLESLGQVIMKGKTVAEVIKTLPIIRQNYIKALAKHEIVICGEAFHEEWKKSFLNNPSFGSGVNISAVEDIVFHQAIDSKSFSWFQNPYMI